MKARKMWATFPKGTSLEIYHMKSEAAENASEWRMNGHDGCHEFPVAVLDVSDPEALVKQVTLVIDYAQFCAECGPEHRKDPREVATYLLRSLGVLPKKRKPKP